MSRYQTHGYDRVSKQVLYELRGDTTAKKQDSASVPKVVEAYLRQASFLQ